MRLTPEQLPENLKRGLAPLYTIHGEEPLLGLEAADRIRARAREEGYAEREVLTVESGFSWSQLAMSGASQSLFAARRIVELRIPTGKPGVEGATALAEYCARLPDDTLTLVMLPGLDWRAQKTEWYGALERAGVLVDARAVGRAALPAWIRQRLALQEQSADEATVNFLADRVEGNLLAAWQEIRKLALLFPAGRLEREKVEQAVLDVARYGVFDLGPTALAGDVARLARMLAGLRGEGAAPPMALWSLAEEIRMVGRVQSQLAAGRAPAQFWRELRVFQAPRQEALLRAAKAVRPREVEEALAHAARIDRMVKGLDRGEVWDELLALGMRFPAAAPGARRSQTR